MHINPSVTELPGTAHKLWHAVTAEVEGLTCTCKCNKYLKHTIKLIKKGISIYKRKRYNNGCACANIAIKCHGKYKIYFFTWFNVQVITKTDVEVQIDVLGFI